MFNSPRQGTLNYLGSAGRILSPALWKHADAVALASDGSFNGWCTGSDFRNFGLTYAVASNVGRYADESGVYRSYEDTGDAIAQIATDRFGAVSLTTTTTDNNESWLQPGGTASVMGLISDTAGSAKLMVFETRVKFAQVTDTYNAFIGMSEEGLAAGDTLTDAGALASKDFIGFQVAEGDGDSLLFVYRKAGQTAQTVLTYGTALAADTYYNLGFVYDPTVRSTPSQRIKIYINNVEQATYVTATNIAAATFPDGEELQPLWGIKNQTNVSKAITLDAWGFYQED